MEKVFNIDGKEITLSFNLATLDREEILLHYPETLNLVAHKLWKSVKEQFGLKIADREFNNIFNLSKKEIVDFVEREGLKKGKIFLCGNIERLLFDYEWLAGYNPETEKKEKLQREFYEALNQGHGNEVLRHIWESIKQELATEIEEAGAEVFYLDRYSDWDYEGPFSGRFLDCKGPEPVIRIAEKFIDAFHSTIVENQKTFLKLYREKQEEFLLVSGFKITK